MLTNIVSRSSVTLVLACILAGINSVTIMINRMHYRHFVESNDPDLALLLLTLYIYGRQPTNKKGYQRTPKTNINPTQEP